MHSAGVKSMRRIEQVSQLPMSIQGTTQASAAQ